jgi:hypothetical protein
MRAAETHQTFSHSRSELGHVTDAGMLVTDVERATSMPELSGIWESLARGKG